MYHRWALTEIAAAVLHGTGQLILDWLPLIDPAREPDNPPSWWLYWSSRQQWSWHRDYRGVPDRYLIEQYIRLSWWTLGYWVDEVGTWAKDTARDLVRGWTGYVLHGWTTFSNWIDSIGIRLGSGMVFWGSTVIDALGKLYNWLPPEIKTGVQSWGALLGAIFERAKKWVIDTYHTLIGLGITAWGWVAAAGQFVHVWWREAKGVLDEFRANPTGFILARLGTYWGPLVYFVNNLLSWYDSLYAHYHADIAGFFADPAGWIWTRLESYVERIW